MPPKSKQTKIYICSVTNCRYYREARRWPEPLSFHEFPSDLTRRSQWLQALGKENWTPRDKAKVCSVHFRAEDYKETARKLLKQTAVPSLNLNLGPLPISELSGSTEDENCLESGDQTPSYSPEPIGEIVRKRVSNVIVVDLIKDKKIKLNYVSEPDYVDERCTNCLEMKKELREVEFQLALVRKELEEQKKLVETLKKQLKR